MKSLVSSHSAYRIGKVLLFVLILIAMVSHVEAQVVIDNIVDRSMNRYEFRFDTLATNAQNIMLNTFFLLATIEVTWSVGIVLIRNEGLQSLLSTIVSRIMFIGFFLYLLQAGSSTAKNIMKSFVDLAVATELTTGEVNPSNIMDLGQDLWARLYIEATSIGVWEILTDENTGISTPIILIFLGMVAFMIMALISAHFGVILIESFFAASGGVILLGLGGSRWTYQYATTYLKYAMSVGMKLFILTIIVGLTLGEINRFMAVADIHNVGNLFALIAFMLFSLVVSTIAPRSVRGMMDGISTGSANINSLSDSRKTISKTTGQVNKLLLPK